MEVTQHTLPENIVPALQDTPNQPNIVAEVQGTTQRGARGGGRGGRARKRGGRGGNTTAEQGDPSVGTRRSTRTKTT